MFKFDLRTLGCEDLKSNVLVGQRNMRLPSLPAHTADLAVTNKTWGKFNVLLSLLVATRCHLRSFVATLIPTVHALKPGAINLECQHSSVVGIIFLRRLGVSCDVYQSKSSSHAGDKQKAETQLRLSHVAEIVQVSTRTLRDDCINYDTGLLRRPLPVSEVSVLSQQPFERGYLYLLLAELCLQRNGFGSSFLRLPKLLHMSILSNQPQFVRR